MKGILPLIIAQSLTVFARGTLANAANGTQLKPRLVVCTDIDSIARMQRASEGRGNRNPQVVAAAGDWWYVILQPTKTTFINAIS